MEEHIQATECVTALVMIDKVSASLKLYIVGDDLLPDEALWVITFYARY